MKFLLLSFFFAAYTLCAQKTKNSFTPKSISISSSYQNEDIFISFGGGYRLLKSLEGELRYGIGARRTLFQASLFSKLDVVFRYNVLRSKRWNLGPTLQFSTMRLSPRIFKPIQRYFSAEIGYFISFGEKLKLIQSSYFGFRSTEFVPVENRYPYKGFAFQIGFSYAL